MIPLLGFAELRPVPWLTEGAISFLEDYFKEHPNAKVLEFGSGASTVWFADKTTNLVSVEHSPQWYTDVKKILADRFGDREIVHLVPRPYYCFCDQFPDEYFDLILVDGRNRKGCIHHSIRILKKGGVLMLDNAERSYYKKGMDLMRGWEKYSDEQTKPDSCDFWYTRWTTTWWVRP